MKNQLDKQQAVINQNIIHIAASGLKLPNAGALRAIELLDEGATIPFLARYRKEVTGDLDEEQLRQLEKRVAYLRQLTGRQQEVRDSIEAQSKLTAILNQAITAATSLQELEDLYLPYRPKRRTRASIAREKGLEPLAKLILAQKTFRGDPQDFAGGFVNEALGVASAEEALAGAQDIVAEMTAEDAEVRRRLRLAMQRQGTITSKLARGAKDKNTTGKFEQYYDYREPLSKIPPHRVLALNRGETEKVLAVAIELPPDLARLTALQVFPLDPRSIFRTDFEAALVDGLTRLTLPALENESRTSLTELAEAHATHVFAANLRPLLLQPPIVGKVVLGIDPGFRTGCKVAVVDPTGKPLANLNIYPHEPKRDWNGAKKTLLELVNRYRVEVIAIGNGTASRETEALAAEVIATANTAAVSPTSKLAYVIVSEAGASVYSASEIARQEFPQLEATQRGNISIARRLQDPLAELVKIDPKAIGVGLYQHDVDQKRLAQALDEVVESCVNYAGVDLNTASRSLLKYVAGINAKVAGAIVAYREANGPFQSRQELRKVTGLGAKTFEQAAGFLKIRDGVNLLDNTFIHPESYGAAQKLVSLLLSLSVENAGTLSNGGSSTKGATMSAKQHSILPDATKIKQFRATNMSSPAKLNEVAQNLGIGVPTLGDILDNLEKPGRDPRQELPGPLLRQDVLKLEDLAPNMILRGTVRNVVDFGVFVDIGTKQEGLVHISEMSSNQRYVKHPLDLVSVGDVIEVRVLQVDKQRGRVGLSMKLELG